MATILSMPKWGLAMKTGRVVEWLKQPGETVQQGEPIVKIESEKAVNDVESPSTGIVRQLVVPEGESAPIGAPLAIITAQEEELSAEQMANLLREEAEEKQRQAAALNKRGAPKAPAGAPTAGTMRAPASAGGRVNASPAARRLAQELGVDLSMLSGTGPRGMIGREDVLRAAEQAQDSSSEEERIIEVDGIAIHCLLAGPHRAPHVVFIHGLGGSLTTWALNLAALAASFRVCALDLPGSGESAKPARDYSVRAQAAFLPRFLDALGPDWQQVSLVGHSLGAAIALDFAAHHPERAERLVLIDSAGLGPEIDPTLLQLFAARPEPETIKAELARFFADPHLVSPSLIEQVYRQRLQPGAYEALQAAVAATFVQRYQKIDLRTALATLNKPVLLIWGTADQVIPAFHAEAVWSAPHGRLELFPDCGHCPHIERSEAFNQLVQAFLSGA
ncbi:acetoin dehydrogenase dihydrolipoyllysine-residue acetyltransferase subunit [Ktedonosporobacter rubrisoli]|uniref:Acetoin dehydrogenase dihydrolipoyllysine-residue acetyltransferase subunit n=1 Tax=Ktedonosporobacter rubrisoli TaxID=2509675 RepID=A0A4P6K1F3_KTERU|nr:acetoin dehydrogenase dihydrolipoyllysine-residue acetyltransferase subunit [Ktedonosporobacter rubrisoli]QBD81652.1 acetoin dehydrogenase dihydrolipoyllysine-residue acetyltransferase subunit [Ktedonosporobacter rubrisoli]